MRSIRLTHELAPRLAAKIKEQRLVFATLTQRYVTGLILVVPDFRLTIHIGTQKACARNCQAIVLGHAAMIPAVKKFFGFPELAFRESDLPSFLFGKGILFFIAAGIVHIDNHRIAIFQDSESRNRSRFCRKFNQGGIAFVQARHVDL